MDDDELDAIEDRAFAATPGPWRHWPEAGWIEVFQCGPKGPYDVKEIIVNGVRPAAGWDGRAYENNNSEPDADFIAHAREDIPALIAEIRRLQNELAQMRFDANPELKAQVTEAINRPLEEAILYRRRTPRS